MLHRLAFTAAMLVAASSAARAEFFNISLDGYCDEFAFSVVNGIAAGVSDSPTPLCDNAYLIGSRLTLQRAISPGGTVIGLASDFGPFGSGFLYQYIVYLNMRTHTFTLYASDGHGEIVESGTFSNIPNGQDRRPGPVLPSISAAIRRARNTPAQ